MAGNRNRQAGHNFERSIVSRYNKFGHINGEGELVPLFPVVGTTRLLSTFMDSMKVDITTENPGDLPAFGLLIQAKNTTNTPQYPKLLTEMKEAVEKFGGIPIVYHKQTERAKTSGDTARFMARGEYVILNSSDFEDIYTSLVSYKEVFTEIMNYFDSFPEEVQEELNRYLNERNV